MKKRLIFKSQIKWGWLLIAIGATLIIGDIITVIYIIMGLIKDYQLIFISLILIIPLIILNYLLYPITKSILYWILKKNNHNLELFTTGIKIKKKMFKWEKIKSISFQTGRLIYDSKFFSGLKLPALQKIYILLKNGKEISSTIDVDYFLKNKRENNNLRKLNELFFGMDKQDILSDWAQKR